MHPAALTDEELLKQCRLGKKRTGGPGGQHRNKVESGVELTHEGTGLAAHAGERRTVTENKRVALFRLRLALALHHRTPPAPLDPFGDTRSPLWRSRTSREGRLVCNPRHRDYPALLAEALDVIEASGADPRRAAARLSCSPSQLVKLVKDHPPALERWNTLRAAHGLHALK